ncbi:hypothetical protein LTS18_003007, partial [Coniosporium uncinatum]
PIAEMQPSARLSKQPLTQSSMQSSTQMPRSNEKRKRSEQASEAIHVEGVLKSPDASTSSSNVHPVMSNVKHAPSDISGTPTSLAKSRSATSEIKAPSTTSKTPLDDASMKQRRAAIAQIARNLTPSQADSSLEQRRAAVAHMARNLTPSKLVGSSPALKIPATDVVNHVAVLATQTPTPKTTPPVLSAPSTSTVPPPKPPSAIVPPALSGELQKVAMSLPSRYRHLAHLVRPLPEKNQPYTLEDDKAMIELFVVNHLKWPEIARYFFPGRSSGTLNTRWCKKLKAIQQELLPEGYTGPLVEGSTRPRERQDFVGLAESDDDEETSGGDTKNTMPRQRSFRERRRVPGSYNIKAAYSALKGIVDEPASVPEDVYSFNTSGQMRETRMSRSTHHQPERSSARIARPRSRDPHSKPYLTAHERQLTCGDLCLASWDAARLRCWEGSVLHVDFTDFEKMAVERAIKSLASKDTTGFNAVQGLDPLQLTEAELGHVHWHMRKTSSCKHRSEQSVRSYLQDVYESTLTKSETKQRLGKPASRSTVEHAVPSSTASILRQRELGLTAKRGWDRGGGVLSRELKNNMYDTLGPKLSFTGMSNDVMAVAWAPDGNLFAAGASAQTDQSSMQYNRQYNLLLGSVSYKALQELPDHWVGRERPTLGVNATRSMHASVDPRLFQTVSMVDFSPDGRALYSAGYDEVVRVWDTTNTTPNPLSSNALDHGAAVDMLTVNRHTGFLATGCKRSEKSIRVYRPTEDHQRPAHVESLFASKAKDRPQDGILPAALRWGLHPYVSSYLLAGFSSTSDDKERALIGQTCLWDIERQFPVSMPNAYNVFDVAWSPHSVNFAVACVAGSNVNRGTRSLIKLFAPKENNRFWSPRELECPAMDINDVVFSPYDPHIISAGCTNGKTYVWDIRSPDRILHTLIHGEPLMELGDPDHRERLDTGIRFCSWGEDQTRLFTGSSDGVLKSWNIYRAPEDVLVQNVVSLNSGIMSGAFSSDFTKLVLGEVNGSVNVLEVGNDDIGIRDVEKFTLHSAPNIYAPVVQPSEEVSGIAAARKLVDDGDIEYYPMGPLPIRQAVQGVMYSGPFDSRPDAPELRNAARAFQRRMERMEPDPSVQQCSLLACVESASTRITPEEAGDSGRSADRIPQSLRTAASTSFDNAATIVPGRAKCSRCSGSALPSLEGDGTAPLLCERCNLTCFRCGGRCKIFEGTVGVRCENCGRAWTANVLGYECRPLSPIKGHERVTSVSTFGASAKPLGWLQGRAGIACFECHGEVERADDGVLECRECGLAWYGEDHGIKGALWKENETEEDHWLGLWQDRPASPPL